MGSVTLKAARKVSEKYGVTLFLASTRGEGRFDQMGVYRSKNAIFIEF